MTHTKSPIHASQPIPESFSSPANGLADDSFGGPVVESLHLSIDRRMRLTLQKLKDHFRQDDDGGILHRAVALLNIAMEADKRGRKLGVLNEDGTIWKEIVL